MRKRIKDDDDDDFIVSDNEVVESSQDESGPNDDADSAASVPEPKRNQQDPATDDEVYTSNLSSRQIYVDPVYIPLRANPIVYIFQRLKKDAPQYLFLDSANWRNRVKKRNLRIRGVRHAADFTVKQLVANFAIKELKVESMVTSSFWIRNSASAPPWGELSYRQIYNLVVDKMMHWGDPSNLEELPPLPKEFLDRRNEDQDSEYSEQDCYSDVEVIDDDKVEEGDENAVAEYRRASDVEQDDENDVEFFMSLIKKKKASWKKSGDPEDNLSKLKQLNTEAKRTFASEAIAPTDVLPVPPADAIKLIRDSGEVVRVNCSPQDFGNELSSCKCMQTMGTFFKFSGPVPISQRSLAIGALVGMMVVIQSPKKEGSLALEASLRETALKSFLENHCYGWSSESIMVDPIDMNTPLESTPVDHLIFIGSSGNYLDLTSANLTSFNAEDDMISKDEKYHCFLAPSLFAWLENAPSAINPVNREMMTPNQVDHITKRAKMWKIANPSDKFYKIPILPEDRAQLTGGTSAGVPQFVLGQLLSGSTADAIRVSTYLMSEGKTWHSSRREIAFSREESRFLLYLCTPTEDAFNVVAVAPRSWALVMSRCTQELKKKKNGGNKDAVLKNALLDAHFERAFDNWAGRVCAAVRCCLDPSVSASFRVSLGEFGSKSRHLPCMISWEGVLEHAFAYVDRKSLDIRQVSEKKIVVGHMEEVTAMQRRVKLMPSMEALRAAGVGCLRVFTNRVLVDSSNATLLQAEEKCQENERATAVAKARLSQDVVNNDEGFVQSDEEEISCFEDDLDVAERALKKHGTKKTEMEGNSTTTTNNNNKKKNNNNKKRGAAAAAIAVVSSGSSSDSSADYKKMNKRVTRISRLGSSERARGRELRSRNKRLASRKPATMSKPSVQSFLQQRKEENVMYHDDSSDEEDDDDEYDEYDEYENGVAQDSQDEEPVATSQKKKNNVVVISSDDEGEERRNHRNHDDEDQVITVEYHRRPSTEMSASQTPNKKKKRVVVIDDEEDDEEQQQQQHQHHRDQVDDSEEERHASQLEQHRRQQEEEEPVVKTSRNRRKPTNPQRRELLDTDTDEDDSVQPKRKLRSHAAASPNSPAKVATKKRRK